MDNSRSEYGRSGSRPYDECPVPVPPETLAKTLAELSDARGLDVVSRALRTRGVSVTLENYDNWDGGIWTWLITVSLHPRDWVLFNGMGKRSTVENELAELANAIVVSDAHKFMVQLSAIAVSTSKEVTNQGRAHSSNPATIEHEGLLFRSKPEVLLFVALRDTGLPVMPLPVVTSNQRCFKRIEPDFVVICRGMTFVVEVDGDRWHQETPATAQERLRHLEDEGVRIIRVSAENCKSSNSAKETAKNILSRIERMLESR
jgi:very-short-patch-repair endonuclease